MFSKIMFHFQELEKPLEILKICHWAPLLEQMEDCNKLHVFLFFSMFYHHLQLAQQLYHILLRHVVFHFSHEH
jgi:hypothetical protein